MGTCYCATTSIDRCMTTGTSTVFFSVLHLRHFHGLLQVLDSRHLSLCHHRHIDNLLLDGHGCVRDLSSHFLCHSLRHLHSHFRHLRHDVWHGRETSLHARRPLASLTQCIISLLVCQKNPLCQRVFGLYLDFTSFLMHVCRAQCCHCLRPFRIPDEGHPRVLHA